MDAEKTPWDAASETFEGAYGSEPDLLDAQDRHALVQLLEAEVRARIRAEIYQAFETETARLRAQFEEGPPMPDKDQMPRIASFPAADAALRGVLEGLDLFAGQLAELRAEVRELRASSLRYRGVWSAAVNDFRRGDLVTTGGSLFHCNVDGATEKPGTSSQWTLTAKSGG